MERGDEGCSWRGQSTRLGPSIGREADEWNDSLVEAAGLPPPTTDPIVHWSPGVDVRIGRPRWAS